MNADELVALNEQIAGMAKAGLPLDHGLSMLAKEMGRGRLRRVTAALGEDLRNGQTLPEALERRRGELPPYYAALAAAGIRTGQLPDVLTTLTNYARTIAQTRSMIVEAITYPLIVLAFAVILFAFMGTIVIPQFQQIFNDFKLPMPMVTTWAMKVTNSPLTWMLAPVVTLLIVAIAARFWIRRTHAGRKMWTRFVYSTPLIGALIHSARLAAFVDLLAVLVKYSVPLPEAFQLAGDASSDPLISDQTKDVRTRLEHGITLGEALTGQDLLPEWVAWMSASGERRGTLADTLQEIAAVYRRHVEARAAVLQNLLPSIMIIILAALLTGLFIVGLVVPLIHLMEGLSK
jgi:type II secretory pathway component PulF